MTALMNLLNLAKEYQQRGEQPPEELSMIGQLDQQPEITPQPEAPQPDIPSPDVTQPPIGQMGQASESGGYESMIGQLQQMMPKPKSKWDKILDAISMGGATLQDVGTSLSGGTGQAIPAMMKAQAGGGQDNMWKMLQFQESMRKNKVMEDLARQRLAKSGSKRDPYSEMVFRENLKGVPSTKQLTETDKPGSGLIWDDKYTLEEAVKERNKLIKQVAGRGNTNKKSLTQKDKEALSWAMKKENINDPRAKKIIAKLGV